MQSQDVNTVGIRGSHASLLNACEVLYEIGNGSKLAGFFF
jgi:hypothetical protein